MSCDVLSIDVVVQIISSRLVGHVYAETDFVAFDMVRSSSSMGHILKTNLQYVSDRGGRLLLYRVLAHSSH